MNKVLKILNPEQSTMDMLNVMDVPYTIEEIEYHPVEITPSEPVHAEEPISDNRPYFKTNSFRKLLDRIGISQRQFAMRHGISIRNVSNWCVSEDSPNYHPAAQYLIDFIIMAYDLRED